MSLTKFRTLSKTLKSQILSSPYYRITSWRITTRPRTRRNSQQFSCSPKLSKRSSQQVWWLHDRAGGTKYNRRLFYLLPPTPQPKKWTSSTSIIEPGQSTWHKTSRCDRRLSPRRTSQFNARIPGNRGLRRRSRWLSSLFAGSEHAILWRTRYRFRRFLHLPEVRFFLLFHYKTQENFFSLT